LRLQLSSSGSLSAYAVEAEIANVADCYIQMVNAMANSSNGTYSPTSGDIRSGLVMRGSTPVSNTLPTDAISVISPGPTSTNTSPSNRAEIRERVSSVDVQTIRTSVSVRQNFPQRMHAVLTGTTVTANNVGGSPAWSLSATGLTGPAGRPGLIAYNEYLAVRYMYVGEYYRCSSKNLTVNGPTIGTWYVELLDKDDNVLHTSSAQFAGQVVVDYEAAALLLPLTQKIRITDGASSLVTVYPNNGVWPGDTWTYTDDTTPSGIVTRTANGLVMARRSPYIITGLSIAPWSAGEWLKWSALANVSGAFLDTSNNSPYLGEIRFSTSGSGTSYGYLRRGMRWDGPESIPSDAFFVGTMRIATDNEFGTNTTFSGAYLRSGAAPQTARVGGYLVNKNVVPLEHQLEEVSASTVVQASVESGALNINRRARIGLWVRSTLATFRAILFRQNSGPSLVVENLTGLASPPPTAGMAVLYGSTSSGLNQYWHGMAVMASAEITMSGPTSGVAAWGLRVRDASGMVVAESGVNVAGVATLNTQTEMDAAYGRYSISVMRSIEAYDTASGDTLSDRLEPEGGIWGGDAFAVASLPPSGGYPASRLAHRKAGAQRLLLKR
jgi:hypothetical protein